MRRSFQQGRRAYCFIRARRTWAAGMRFRRSRALFRAVCRHGALPDALQPRRNDFHLMARREPHGRDFVRLPSADRRLRHTRECGQRRYCARRPPPGRERRRIGAPRRGPAFVHVPSLVWLPFLFPGQSNAFFRMPGASDPGTLQPAWLYNMWMPPMTLVISFTYIVNSIFRCRGDTMAPLRFFLVANSLNFALDPLFIFVFGWACAALRGRCASSAAGVLCSGCGARICAYRAP